MMLNTAQSMTDSPGNLTPSSLKPYSAGRQRIIASCLTCRRRKVRCDHGHPTCGACMRGNHVCTYATDQGLGFTAQSSSPASGRIAKPTPPGSTGRGSRGTDVQARLDRLESLLEKAVQGQVIPTRPPPPPPPPPDPVKSEPEAELTPSSTAGSASSHGAGISSDNHDGTLLLEDGQSQFVSSLHWALLADEIQDIKALLGERSGDDHSAEKDRQFSQNSLISLLALGKAKVGLSLETLLPDAPEHIDDLLDIYFYNVDPMIRVVHKPTLLRKFHLLVRECAPIVFAIFYAAIHSLPAAAVEERFGDRKDDLLQRYEQGVEISLARDNFLTTSSLEVLQGFLIWLTCITKEDDVGKGWTLLGIAIRIALNQGLHRDPSLFPEGSFDAVTIEIRRRLWHQIFYLEYRSAECKGQEPNISEDDFTTLLPRNVDDEDLIEGMSPGPSPYDEEKFTGMTFPIVRFIGMRTLRRVVQSTYRLERRIVLSGLHGTSAPDPVQELQTLYEQIKVLVDEMNGENRKKYLKYCNPDVGLQRLCLGLANLMEWRAFVLFWLRMPRAYRDTVFSIDIRKLIFEKSVNVIEALNGANMDIDVARFQWHIGGHASFQAIMHVLTELRNKELDSPDRPRALRALRMVKILRESNTSQAWVVVKGMIEKIIAEHSAQQGASTAHPFTPNLSSSASTISTSHDSNPYVSGDNYHPPLYVDRIPAYAIQHPPYTEPPPPIDFGDFSYSNMMGMEVPEMNVDFDWGFWGDSVNLAPPLMGNGMNFWPTTDQ